MRESSFDTPLPELNNRTSKLVLKALELPQQNNLKDLLRPKFPFEDPRDSRDLNAFSPLNVTKPNNGYETTAYYADHEGKNPLTLILYTKVYEIDGTPVRFGRIDINLTQSLSFGRRLHTIINFRRLGDKFILEFEADQDKPLADLKIRGSMKDVSETSNSLFGVLISLHDLHQDGEADEFLILSLGRIIQQLTSR